MENHAKRSRAHRIAVILRVFVLMESVFVRTDSRIRRAVNRSEISDTVVLHINVRIYYSVSRYSLTNCTRSFQVLGMELVIFVNACACATSDTRDLRATRTSARVRP